MPNTLDKNQDEKGFFALFKGPSGSGKTVGALSFPEPCILDHDVKMPAIAHKHFPKKSIDYFQFSNIFEIQDKFREWSVNCPYETLIGDSITSLSYTTLKSVDEVKDTDILKMMKNVKKTSGGKDQVEFRGYDYYNAEDSFLKWYIDYLKALWLKPGNPKHVIVVAHILTHEQTNIITKVTTRTRRIVTAGKAIAAYIPAQFDNVFLFGTQQTGGLSINDPLKTTHKVITQTYGEDDAKTAFNLATETDFTGKNLYDELQKQIAGAEMFL